MHGVTCVFLFVCLLFVLTYFLNINNACHLKSEYQTLFKQNIAVNAET